MPDNKLRVRIDLRTDGHLRWFAEVELHSYEESSGMSFLTTRPAETWREALDLAVALIEERRRSRGQTP